MWARVCILAFVVFWSAHGLAYAGAQSADRQRCLNDVNKRASVVVRQQGRANFACVKNAQRGLVARLGVPPQSETAAACLTNDVKGLVGKRIDALRSRDAVRCGATRPDFGYAGAATMAAAAVDESVAFVTALFGSDLDAALVPAAEDGDGARCQRDVLGRAGKLVDRLWKDALRAKKNALAGVARTTGSDPTAPVGSGAELLVEIEAALAADERGRIARDASRIRDPGTKHCVLARTPLAQLFPGCAAATVDAVAACAEAAARGTFFRTLAAFDVLPVSCDREDDGVVNETCLDPALVAHVLDRTGYGPDAWTRARIAALGIEGYILEQLTPEAIDDAALDAMLAQYPSLTMSFTELRDSYPADPPEGVAGIGTVRRELQEAKVLRAVASHRQLEQVLTDFWFNHFNVAASSRRRKWDISPYERIAIRPHVLGRFRDLLLAVARSPAMGDFLDNRQNRVGELNENYSREFMELHTAGVDSGYTEQDVVEVARCFTGWREDYDAPDGFEFRADWHDQGAKTIMGTLQIPPGGGEQDGIAVIDFFAALPQTAERVVRKLIVRFVAETPPLALVDAAVATYLASDGDLRAVMETILLSPEFLDRPAYRKTKVKRPMHLIPSLARALGADVTRLNLGSMRNRVRDLGEELYQAAPPPGYPDVSGYWASPGTLITRFNELERAARGERGYTFTYPATDGTSAGVVDALAGFLFTAAPSAETREVAIAFLDGLAEPDPTARVAQAAAVLLSSPEFLLH
jgi:uncharacterized protein (DUF1800 family)